MSKADLKVAQSSAADSGMALTHFCAMLTKYRKESGMSQTELAERLGTSRNTIVNWEKGKRTPDILSAYAIAQTLNISVDQLLGVSNLSHEEFVLIDHFRKLSIYGKKIIKRMLSSLLKAEMEEKDELLRKSYRVIDCPATPVAAGSGCEFRDIESSYMFVKTNQTIVRADAVLRVSGRSMEPFYHDGDMVYVEYCDAASDGSDVIARIGSEKSVVIKRLQDGKLYSLNRALPFEDRTEEDDVRIIGIVLGIVRNDDLPDKADITALHELFHEEIHPYLICRD